MDDSEDTAFYAHLTSQILLLMDEDDETHAPHFRRRPTVTRASASTSKDYFSWFDRGTSLEVPGWMESLWANNGAGTGVFIPRVVAVTNPRRRRHRHKSRKNNDGGRIRSPPGSAGQKIHG